MSEHVEKLDRMIVAGFEKNTESGFVLPIFKKSKMGNECFRAVTVDEVHIHHFEKYDPIHEFQSYSEAPIETFATGDPLVYFFLWEDVIYFGSKKKIFDEVQIFVDEISQELQLSILDFEDFLSLDQYRRAVSLAFEYIEDLAGKFSAETWFAQSFLRPRLVRRAKEELLNTGTAPDKIGAFARLLSVETFGGRVIVNLPDEIPNFEVVGEKLELEAYEILDSLAELPGDFENEIQVQTGTRHSSRSTKDNGQSAENIHAEYVALLKLKYFDGSLFKRERELIDAFFRPRLYENNDGDLPRDLGATQMLSQKNVTKIKGVDGNIELFSRRECEFLIEAWRNGLEDYQFDFFGPSVILAFEHLMLHQVAGGESLENLANTFDMLTNFCTSGEFPPYPASAASIQQLCSNVMGVLNGFRSDTGVGEFVKNIEDLADKSKSMFSPERGLQLHTPNLADMKVKQSVIMRYAGDRNYQTFLNILKEISEYRIPPSARNLHYIRASVQAAHGYSTPLEIEEFLNVFEKCQRIYLESKTADLADPLLKIYNQTIRETQNHEIGRSPEAVMSLAVKLAFDFPEEKYGFIQSILHELNTLLGRQFLRDEENDYKFSMNVLVSLLDLAEEQKYSENSLYCGGFIQKPLFQYVEENNINLNELEDFFRAVNRPETVSLPNIVSNVNPYGTYYSTFKIALSKGQLDKAQRCIDALKLFAKIFPNHSSPQIISLIESEYEGVKEAERRDG